MAVRRPAPLNQFYRLDYDEVRKVWFKTTRWGTIYDSTNCMAAQGAIAIDAHTGGRIRSTPPMIRANQFDKSGGIGVDDVADAWRKLWGETFWTPAGFNFADTINAVKAGRYVVVAMDYGQISELHKCQAFGTFGHAMGLDHIRSDGQIGYFDSLCTDLRYMPQYQMRRAMEKTARDSGRNIENLFVGLTRVRAQTTVPPVYKYGGQPTGRGSFKVSESGHALRRVPSTHPATIIKNLAAGTTFRAAQTTKATPQNGNMEWKGTADGNCWYPSQWLIYVGPYTNKEAIR